MADAAWEAWEAGKGKRQGSKRPGNRPAKSSRARQEVGPVNTSVNTSSFQRGEG